MTEPDRSPPAASGARREAAAEDPHAQLARYQALVEYAPDAIVILDLDVGHFVTVNAAAEQLFGMNRAELLRVGPAEVSPPAQPDGRSSEDAAMELIGRALAGERPRFEWTHRRADGVDVPCEVRLLRLPSPDRRLVRGSVVDITERREAEAARAAALAEAAGRRAAEAGVARLRATVAGLNAIVWERDPATLRLTFVNERAEELLGYPAARWLAEQGLWTRILHPDDREQVLARVRAEVDSGGVDFALTYRVRAADGRWVWLEHLGHVARDETGAAHTLHAVLFDVTDARRRERAAALLAAAAAALAAPGDVEDRLGAVTELLVRELGDWAAVWLAGDDRRFRPVAAAPAALAARVLALAPLRAPERFAARIRAGRAFAVPEVTAAMRQEATADDEQYAALSALGGDCWLVAPLTAGDDVAGLLTIATQPRPGYDDADVALAADLGARIAAMVAAEGLAARQRQLHALAVTLAAAGTAAEAGAALTAGLYDALDASVVAVCTLGEDGQLHTVDVHGYSPGWAARFATIRLTAPLPLADAARTRSPVWLPDRATLLARYPEVAPFLQPQTQATASVPLLAGHRLVGALAVTFPSPRRFDAAERAFLLTVAGQVAAALERAALADARREMADTLQRSLLPAGLPEPDRVTVAARYLPAVSGTSAGGDWYDVLALPDGRVALAVGDVVGHGAPAAAVMGQLRAALAILLRAGHPPAEALEQLDGYAELIDGARVATVACLTLDPGTHRLAYSRAGHPPLLLLPPGAASDAEPAGYLADGLGPALGLHRPGRRPEAITALPPGATLLLYTDGLVERRDTVLDDGLDRLAAAVTAHRFNPPDALLDGVLADLAATGAGDDDVAVVALRPRPAPLRAALPADPTRLAGLRQSVTRWALEAALAPDATEDLQLALGEAAANAVEHAYRHTDTPGRVLVELDAEPDGGVRAAVTDGGTWQPAAADAGFRGRGLGIIAALAGDVAVTPDPAGTTLRFRLPPPTAPVTVPAPRLPPPRGKPATLLATDVHGRRCLELIGDLDLAGVEAVRADLLAGMGGDRPIVLDLTRLGYVASVGVGLLLEAANAAGDRLEVLLPPGGAARRLLNLTGLTEIVTTRGSSAAR